MAHSLMHLQTAYDKVYSLQKDLRSTAQSQDRKLQCLRIEETHLETTIQELHELEQNDSI